MLNAAKDLRGQPGSCSEWTSRATRTRALNSRRSIISSAICTGRTRFRIRYSQIRAKSARRDGPATLSLRSESSIAERRRLAIRWSEGTGMGKRRFHGICREVHADCNESSIMRPLRHYHLDHPAAGGEAVRHGDSRRPRRDGPSYDVGFRHPCHPYRRAPRNARTMPAAPAIAWLRRSPVLSREPLRRPAGRRPSAWHRQT